MTSVQPADSQPTHAAPRCGAPRVDHPFLAAVRAALIEHRLCQPGERIVVAVSGGPDSVALLRALHALSPRFGVALHVAHLDHALRADSMEDAAAVQRLATSLGLPLTLERATFIKRGRGGSLEAAARDVRYAFLDRVAQDVRAHRVAAGHTRDDQVETFLAALLRGTGSAGLTAMPWARRLQGSRELIRPLLGLWRREVLSYLQAIKQPVREDATNQDLRYLRNRIRHELLPTLEASYHPEVRQHVADLIELLQAERQYLEASVDKHYPQVAARTDSHAVTLDLARLQQLPLALRRALTRRAIHRVQGDLRQFAFQHWREIASLIEERPEGAVVDLPGSLRVRKVLGRLIVERTDRPTPAGGNPQPGGTERELMRDGREQPVPGIAASSLLEYTKCFGLPEDLTSTASHDHA